MRRSFYKDIDTVLVQREMAFSSLQYSYHNLRKTPIPSEAEHALNPSILSHTASNYSYSIQPSQSLPVPHILKREIIRECLS